MSSASIGSSTGSPLSLSGLGSGLNTSAIVSALIAAERQPIDHLTLQQEKLSAAQQQLQTLQSSLQQLSFAVSEFALPSLFDTAQTVTSNEPLRVSATTTSGAGVGGYEVEVTQLANAAQRTFKFASPAAEDTITIDGHEYKLAAGATAKELAEKINSDSTATVYAAVTDSETVVLSDRATGAGGGEFIKVTDPGATLTEKEGTAKEGKNAVYKVNGVEGTSTTNTVSNAIAGVTLTLSGLTPSGPVTIDVQPPGVNAKAIESQVQAFVNLYNSTVEAIHRQLSTKPLEHPQNAAERAVGSLFGDVELSGLVSRMRQAMYEPISGLGAEMSSPLNVGIVSGGSSSQSAIDGLLKLEPTKLEAALNSNPEAVKQMLQQWAKSLQSTIDGVGAPGEGLSRRIESDSTQISGLKTRIATMNEMLAVRQKSLQATYAQLETIVARNNTQTNWLLGQSEQLTRSGL